MADHRPALAGRARPRRRAVVAAVALALLAGCASIPTDGPVVEGAPVGEDVFRRVVPPPAAGAAPVEIVRGFLDASAGAGTAVSTAGSGDRDYEVARSYLAPRMATDWRPTDETVVYSGARPQVAFPDAAGDVPGSAGDGTGASDRVTARIDVPVLGTVDASGRYQQAPPGTVRSVELTVQRGADRQWRIASTPDLALVSSSDFDAVFRAYRLYFLDPTSNYLVPDLRWFPQSDSTRTRLVAELLQGPSSWLSPGVVTAFPSGTRMAAPQAVRVDGGVATVPLTSTARSASPQQRQLMRAQLLASLRASLGVTQVRLVVDGGELAIEDPASAVRRDPDVAPGAVLLQGEVPVLLSGAVPEPIPDLPTLEGLGPSHPALAYDGGVLAVLVQERSQLRTLAPGDEQVSEPLVVGADLTPPSFDWRGNVWTSPAVSDGTVQVAQPGVAAGGVEAPWLAGRRVSSLRVSRDGTRAVLTSVTAEGVPSVDVVAVVRDGDGVPVRLSGPLQLALGTPLAAVRDAVWTGEDGIAVLARPAGAADVAVLPVQIGGTAQAPLAPVPGAADLAAGNGPRSLLVTTADGRVLQQEGSSWVELPEAAGLVQPAFEG